MSVGNLLHMTAPLRDAFDIPFHAIGGTAEPLRLALVGGLHGNELNGIFVLGRLADFLAEVAAGARLPLRLHGRVVIIPAVNVLGVNTGRRAWPFDGTDLNRMFPGYDAGETTQRIAHAVLEATRPSYFRIDVHSSNPEFEEVPQVRLYDPTEAERQTARDFGLPAVVERPTSAVASSTLLHAWRGSGGESFVLQAGHAGSLQLKHCERLFHALVGFLARTGIISGRTLADEDDEVHYFGPRQTFPLVAEKAGLFVSTLQVGTWLQPGDPIGTVYDAFAGRLRAEVRAPVAGMVSGLRRQPLLCEGDLVARIQTRHEIEAGAETFLYGHGQ